MPARQLHLHSPHFRACCCSVKVFCVIVLSVFLLFDVTALIGGGTASALFPPVLNTTSIDETEDRQTNGSTPGGSYASVNRMSRVAVENQFSRNLLWLKLVSIIVAMLVLVGIGISNPFLLIPKLFWDALFLGCFAILVINAVFILIPLALSGVVKFGIKPENIGDLLIGLIFLVVGAINVIITGYIFMCVIRCCQLIARENKLKREQEMHMIQLNVSPMCSSKY